MIMNSVNPHGGDGHLNNMLYDFSANISPLGTPENVKAAIRASADKVCDYPDSHCNELRQKISEYENTDKQNIICGNGASDIIFSYVLALKPKKALIVSPAFCEYENALKAVGSNIQYCQLGEDDGFGLNNLIQNIASILDKTFDVVFICNPNNPTGKVYNINDMSFIAQYCNSIDTALFVDECFMDLTDMCGSNSLIDCININKRIFVLKAFTKSYGMAGVRLGYGLSSDRELLDRMSAVSPAWNISTVAQMAGIAACNCRKFLADNLEIVAAERKFLTSELRRIGYEVFDSDVNFILFKADEQLYNRLMEKRILIRCCNNFRGLDKSYYRCAVKSHMENAALIEVLDEISAAQ